VAAPPPPVRNSDPVPPPAVAAPPPPARNSDPVPPGLTVAPPPVAAPPEVTAAPPGDIPSSRPRTGLAGPSFAGFPATDAVLQGMSVALSDVVSRRGLLLG
ncbi:MAG: hypothetical protein ACO3JL_19635, partial [Myxococcota bacterium]